MPNYTWKCANCGEEKEIYSSIEDRDIGPGQTLSHCPGSFSGHAWRRLLQAPAFQLQGGGWYREGYNK